MLHPLNCIPSPGFSRWEERNSGSCRPHCGYSSILLPACVCQHLPPHCLGEDPSSVTPESGSHRSLPATRGPRPSSFDLPTDASDKGQVQPRMYPPVLSTSAWFLVTRCFTSWKINTQLTFYFLPHLAWLLAQSYWRSPCPECSGARAPVLPQQVTDGHRPWPQLCQGRLPATGCGDFCTSTGDWLKGTLCSVTDSRVFRAIFTNLVRERQSWRRLTHKKALPTRTGVLGPPGLQKVCCTEHSLQNSKAKGHRPPLRNPKEGKRILCIFPKLYHQKRQPGEPGTEQGPVARLLSVIHVQLWATEGL